MFIELTNEKLMECDGGNTFYDLGENIIRSLLIKSQVLFEEI